jgi:5-methyltetrahydropteroyltriglutamate--homocysteine methyltransferase
LIDAYLTGISPRGDALIRATRAFDRGRASGEELEAAFLEDAGALVRLQLGLGIRYVSDGMLRWQDLLRPFALGWRGLEAGPLARWFDNNTFYRRPIIVGEIGSDGGALGPFIELAAMPPGVDRKAVLPSPYAFAKLSEDRFYGDPAELAMAIAGALRREAESLIRMGFSYIQFSEPCLAYGPPKPRDEVAMALEAISAAARGLGALGARTCLYVYFGDASPLLPDLAGLPIDDIGIDMTESDPDPDSLSALPADKGLALGIADGRNSLVEGPREIAASAERALGAVEPDALFLCPSCEMEYLPRSVADRKLEALAMAARALGGLEP